MAGQFTRLQKTYKIMDADGVKLYTGVFQSGDGECKKPTAGNEIPLGIVDNDERVDDPMRAGGDQTGRDVAVKLEGIGMLRLADTVSVGERVYFEVGGEGKAVPTTENATPLDYNVVGFAEKDGQEGDVIPIRMDYHVITR